MTLPSSTLNGCHTDLVKNKAVLDTAFAEPAASGAFQHKQNNGSTEQASPGEEPAKASISAVDRAYFIARARTYGSLWFVKTAGRDKCFKETASHDKEVAKRIQESKTIGPVTKLFWKGVEV